MNSINSRIKAIRETLFAGEKAKHQAFCEAVGVKQTQASNWIREGSSVGSSVIEQILKAFPQINANWLITGEGEMLLEHPEEKIESNLNDEAKLITNPNIKMIPLVSQYAQAGYLSGFADAEYMETLPRIPVFVDHEPHVGE